MIGPEDDRDDVALEFGPERDDDGNINTAREDALYRHAKRVYNDEDQTP